MKLTIKFILPFLILLNSLFSIDYWSTIPLGNTTLKWIINFSIIIIILIFKNKFFRPSNKKDYIIISIYFIWLIIGIIRGMFIAENYWEWKQLIDGSFILSLPVFVYIFNQPKVLQLVLKFWFRYALLLFIIWIFWTISEDAYHFYLGPVLAIACFFPILDKKWKIIFMVLIILMIISDFGARSQIIKAVVAILMSLAYFFGKYLSVKILKITHWFLYLLPIVLIGLGLSGVFNIFEDFSAIAEQSISSKKLSEKKSLEVSTDTRTFIYVEVIESAIKNNYVVFGRTPARGNDSVYFGEAIAEDLKINKFERHNNEVCFPNVFTWLGIIGMLLYCFIYLKSSYLALYQSNSIFLKLIGVFISFHFLYGWIEDINRFDIANISLWMFIAMGFSEQFRKMNNQEFIGWIKSSLPKI
ncbi:hypothetical protein GCM10010992_03250 [Cloacibacterium rupense]|uniref:O-antigen ligase n=1 Tax=Cloacibacterium rupense TaxID=517423 RepID=A0ABQ2NHZ2_9FLAO|nr:hypothetical protein [Cloacibacterium rupense]GGP01724.1 hypothetical protein GCM10010992_03250 [Cloacibacterium rupense]